GVNFSNYFYVHILIIPNRTDPCQIWQGNIVAISIDLLHNNPFYYNLKILAANCEKFVAVYSISHIRLLIFSNFRYRILRFRYEKLLRNRSIDIATMFPCQI
ncbi:hypothetical protein KJ636_04845, partial [Patescibacteria group bacterium]|nr:hypothetical protein [Patescibacteria group bacterium]